MEDYSYSREEERREQSIPKLLKSVWCDGFAVGVLASTIVFTLILLVL